MRPRSPDAGRRAIASWKLKFAKLSAAEFDRMYMKEQVKEHKDAVRAFEREAKHGKDADARKWTSDQTAHAARAPEGGRGGAEVDEGNHDVRDRMRP